MYSPLPPCPLAMPTASRAAAATAAALLLALAGCASTPLPDDPRAPPVVTRTAGTTVWATPEAEAAALAAAEAAAAARRAGATRPATPAARPAAPAPAAAASAPPPASSAPAAPLDVAAPLQRLVFFEFDSFDIHPDFREMLQGHALALKADPARSLVVEGHADDRGGAEYNLALGQKRAEAVVKTLLLLGARESQLEAVSFGDTRPVDPARTFEAWAKNRRAELRER
jgi:peptidoglycan-associated lipoprotein